MRPRLIVWAFAGLAVCTGTVSATGLVYEPFNYTLGAGSSGQSGGTGFLPGSSWAYSEAVSGSISSSTIAPGLTFSDLPVTGNSVLLQVISSSSSGFGDTVHLKRRPASVPNGTTDEFWTRYLFRIGTNHTNTDGFLAGVTIDDAENVSLYHKFGSWAITGAANDHGGLSVDSSISVSPTATASLSDSNVYMLISKFTGVNAPSTTARVGKWWALSVADYDAIKGGGITETELDAVHSQFATETVMPTAQQPLNFTTNDFYNLRGYRPPISNAFAFYYFDELYSGTTLGDLGLPVPAPASMVLLLSAGVCFRRRRVT